MRHMPTAQDLWHDAATISAVAIFVVTYIFLATGTLPGCYLDRAGATLLGASVMVWLGVLSLEEACRVLPWRQLLPAILLWSD
jgi:Na+/H+ antiporter NhaD/arsenite permease-like protein